MLDMENNGPGAPPGLHSLYEGHGYSRMARGDFDQTIPRVLWSLAWWRSPLTKVSTRQAYQVTIGKRRWIEVATMAVFARSATSKCKVKHGMGTREMLQARRQDPVLRSTQPRTYPQRRPSASQVD